MLLYRFTSLPVVYCLFNCRWQSVYDIRYSVYRLLHPII